MYTFAVIALLALATVKIVDFLVDFLPGDQGTLRSLLTFVLAVAGVLVLDFSMFTGWGIPIRNATLGVWLTGFAVAGATSAWRALFGFLTHDRATSDETLGAPHASLHGLAGPKAA
jgi:hypothetical protein